MSFVDSIFKIFRIGSCFVVTVFVTQSCDPARILVIKASDKPNTSVTIYASRNILPGTNRDDIEKITIRIPASETNVKRDTLFYYGFGGWPNQEHMHEFSKNIDSIIIVNNDNKLSLTNQENISNYLVKHRHGFAKRILTIKAK